MNGGLEVVAPPQLQLRVICESLKDIAEAALVVCTREQLRLFASNQESGATQDTVIPEKHFRRFTLLLPDEQPCVFAVDTAQLWDELRSSARKKDKQTTSLKAVLSLEHAEEADEDEHDAEQEEGVHTPNHPLPWRVASGLLSIDSSSSNSGNKTARSAASSVSATGTRYLRLLPLNRTRALAERLVRTYRLPREVSSSSFCVLPARELKSVCLPLSILDSHVSINVCSAQCVRLATRNGSGVVTITNTDGTDPLSPDTRAASDVQLVYRPCAVPATTSGTWFVPLRVLNGIAKLEQLTAASLRRGPRIIVSLPLPVTLAPCDDARTLVVQYVVPEAAVITFTVRGYDQQPPRRSINGIFAPVAVNNDPVSDPMLLRSRTNKHQQ